MKFVTPVLMSFYVLSFSQFIKAIGSMIAVPPAGWLALQLGDRKLLSQVFGVVSLLSVVWLYFTEIEETKKSKT